MEPNIFIRWEKTHLKVKGFPAVLKVNVGSRRQILCKCCGEQLSPNDWTFRIEPHNVEQYIRKMR